MSPGTEPVLHILRIDGMTCASCVGRVTKALEHVPGVESAEVSLPLGEARVWVRDDSLDPSLLQSAATKAGMSAEILTGDSGEVVSQIPKEPSLAWALGVVGAALVVMGLEMVPWAGVPMRQWVAGAAALLFLLTLGRPSLLRCWHSLRGWHPDMHLLVGLGVLAAMVSSLFALLVEQPGQTAFGAAVGILAFVNLGRTLEERARSSTGDAVTSLMRLREGTARVVRRRQVQEILAQDVRQHDLLLVAAGERIAADGTIQEGATTIDESLMTGESLPLERGPGDPVIGGTVNGTGEIKVRVTGAGEESRIFGLIAALRSAQASKAPIEQLVDRVASVFVPLVLLIAAVVLLVHLVIGTPVVAAILHAAATLVVACPCALGLATPCAVVAAVGRASELGILLKDARAVERAASVRRVFMDKTGTLTAGQPSLVRTVTAADLTEEEALAVAATLESRSHHPLAGALRRAAQGFNLESTPGTEVRELPGAGIVGLVEGRSFQLLRTDADRDRPLLVNERASGFQTSVTLLEDGVPRAVFWFEDQIRPEAREALSALKHLGLELGMLSGDRQSVAQSVGSALGFDEVRAPLLPEEKLQCLRETDAQAPAAMVGDGINDALSLSCATLGVAMGSGTDVAQDAADATLLRNDLRLLPTLIQLARATRRVIWQNLTWAFAYNILAIPIATGFLAPWGLRLPPMGAAVAMACSSLFVVLNALRLKRFEPTL